MRDRQGGDVSPYDLISWTELGSSSMPAVLFALPPRCCPIA